MPRVLRGLASVCVLGKFACWDAWESLGAVGAARTIKIKSLIAGSDGCLSPVFVVVCIVDLSFLVWVLSADPITSPSPYGTISWSLVFKQNLGVSRTPSYVFCPFCPTSTPSPSVYSLRLREPSIKLFLLLCV